ncbi:MAG: hypothetical protein U0Q16_00050 [Bryobacteraceae bacterium]
MQTRRPLALLSVSAVMLCQSPPPQPPAPPADVAPGGVFRIPSKVPEPDLTVVPKQPEAPKQVVLTNTGKPIALPFQCTDDDIQTFGMTCSLEDPCPVFLELAAVHPVGQKIFLVGNVHDGSSTMYSVLLASDDGGKTWTEPVDRYRSAGLDHIQFIDFETGWISGHTLQALPRDPFFLLTVDGGKSWKKRMLFNEPRVAGIDQFYFESRTAGAMIVDRTAGAEAGRWELYDTMTGGDSWMVRQVSTNPLRLKVTAKPNADWRLQPDQRTKTNAVQRRTGQKWESIASFAVQVGQCKPANDALQEPPPPPEPAAAPTTSLPPVRQPGSSKKPSLKKR